MITDIVLLIFIVCIASILQTSTGYGFSIIGTPFLFMLYPAHTAIQINIILSIFLSIFMIRNIRNEIDRDLLKQLIRGSFGGLIIGIFIYMYVQIQYLKIGVGIIVLLLTMLLIFQYTVARSRKRDLLAGGVSGMLTTSIGVPGPPLLLYFSGVNMDKTTLRSTTLAYYLFVYAASLIMQIAFGGTNIDIWMYALISLPALFLGVFLGKLLFQWISQAIFLLITYTILIFTGIYLIVTSM
ncbi:sulfite exporter TauE/SafE family protein [Pseudogracilibacillus sp. SO10305]|uniref:sulfite exporter TauE/SafE family protein n=1 Tax=Pseudogracilibacillus sp. SO10305 TaxID=3098292 RepID=UPI00300E1386